MPGVLVVAVLVVMDLGGLECELGIKLYSFSSDDALVCMFIILISSVAITYCNLLCLLLCPLLYTIRFPSLHVISTWSALEPKFRICPRLSLSEYHSRLPLLRHPLPSPHRPPAADSQPRRLYRPWLQQSVPRRQPQVRSTLSTPQAMQHTFGGKYRIEEAIANGGCGTPSLFSFPDALLSRPHPTPGTVYLGTHTVAGKEVAIKLQPTVPRNSPIRQESKIYKTLSGSPGIPWIMWSGKHGDFDVMILDLLGPSLEDLFKMCNKHFSLKTVLLIADQLVSTSPHTTTSPTSPPQRFLFRRC